MDMIGVIRNTEKQETETVARRIEDYLNQRGVRTYLSGDGSDLPDPCSCALVLGGDGTLLRAAKVVLDRQLPLLGINLGTLGYLAGIEVSGIPEALEKLLQGSYTIERRMMLKGDVMRGDTCIYRDVALNDIVIRRQKTLRSFRILNYVNDEFLNTFNADGVIIATATGSTGYNLSVGGPIVKPEAELVLMSPLAPHSLISRSLIFSGTDRVRIEIGEGAIGPEKEVVCVQFDGAKNLKLDCGDRVEIRRSEKYTKIMKLDNISFLEVLRRKMADV